MSAYCPVSLDGHHGVNVGLAVDDLAGGGHLRWQGIAGIGVCGGVAGGGGRVGEAVDGSDQGDDGGVGDAPLGCLPGDGVNEFVVAYFQDMHGALLAVVVVLVCSWHLFSRVRARSKAVRSGSRLHSASLVTRSAVRAGRCVRGKVLTLARLRDWMCGGAWALQGRPW